MVVGAWVLIAVTFLLILEWDAIPVGTKSLLVGVHMFWWHPITVWIAWKRLYGQWPDWRTVICIWIHDWGYWGCRSMDGPDGMEHTTLGAEIATFLFGWEYEYLLKYHSRYLAIRDKLPPSMLCWPDKLSMMYDPNWFYLFRAKLSGEIREYHANAIKRGFIQKSDSYELWLNKLKAHLAIMAKNEAKNYIKKPCPPTTT